MPVVSTEPQRRAALERALGVPVLGLSAVSGEGLREVLEAVTRAVFDEVREP